MISVWVWIVVTAWVSWVYIYNRQPKSNNFCFPNWKIQRISWTKYYECAYYAWIYKGQPQRNVNNNNWRTTSDRPFTDGQDQRDYGEYDVKGAKPVIYLYPTKKEEIKVQLSYKWKLIADYPAYDERIQWWEVIAQPDGTLINKADGEEYSYLFWEWLSDVAYDMSKWFLVKWSETREFLQKTLAKIWLTPKEYNEFIVYRYPKMKDNIYNLIMFAGEEYTNTAPLTITPKPDSLLRVFMVWKPMDTRTNVEPQEIKPFDRKWFSVVEWWWSELPK